jgi:signal transduction histidine kinase
LPGASEAASRLGGLRQSRGVADSAVPDRGVTLGVEVDTTLEATGDERLLYTAVGNLVHNALNAVRAHGGELSVRNLPGKGCVCSVRLAAERDLMPGASGHS